MRIGFGLGVVTLALVGGCQSEQRTKADDRQKWVANCVSKAKARDVAPGFDVARFCECSADGVLKGRSLADLDKMSQAEMTAAFGPVGQQCAAEQMPAGAAAQPAAPAPAGEPAAPAGAVKEPTEAVADDVEETE
jgi:hypothetical protein